MSEDQFPPGPPTCPPPAEQPPSQPPAQVAPTPPQAPPVSSLVQTKTGTPLWKIIVGIVVGLGVVAGLWMLSIGVLVGIVAAMADERETMGHHVLRDGDRNQVVAVFAVTDMIDEESAAEFSMFRKHVEDVDRIKAVVVRVDSGGGGVSASDRIYRMVKSIRTKLDKPVLVSMGSVAASGGYYVAAGADVIYAEPNTVTGSIGVISVWPVFKGLMDKYGVEIVTIRSDPSRRWKAAANFWEAPDERIRNNVREKLDAIHANFEGVVRSERGSKLLTRETKVEAADANGNPIVVTETEPLNGQVYLADEAKRFGLIDRVGYLADAADEAAAMAGLDKPKVVVYYRRPTLRETIGFQGNAVQIDAKLLYKLTTPRILMLWKAQ